MLQFRKGRAPMPTVKKIWNILSTAIVCLVVLAAIVLLGSRLMGYRVFNIVSGSMEPKYNVGDLIYVKEVDPQTIKVGDVITFVLNEDLVVATHRVVRIDSEKSHLYTKGDANEDVDGSLVHHKNVVGTPTTEASSGIRLLTLTSASSTLVMALHPIMTVLRLMPSIWKIRL